ncbi:MAG: hypothetical protein HQL23_02125 [Candidatus Omnitrophica bacterium]|nr:hypothetical protein [Candidatus Omnitrophota bacterium]
MIATVFIPYLWGLAEGTFFFIVPDVWLTGLAFFLPNRKMAYRAVMWAVLGALSGGLLMYFVGKQTPMPQLTLRLDRTPGISANMVNQVAGHLRESGLISVFNGMFRGIPYKIYAAEWGRLSGNITLFLFFSILARATRFLVGIFIAQIIDFSGNKCVQQWPTKKGAIFSAFWIIFYFFYFLILGW